MRKLLLSLGCLFFMAGLVIAGEVTLVKFDKEKKEVTVKEDDKEKTYKYDDKTKFSTTDKDGKASEAKLEAFEKRAAGKDGKGGAKLDIKAEKDVLTEVSWKGGKK